jgi:hypothetical protein
MGWINPEKFVIVTVPWLMAGVPLAVSPDGTETYTWFDAALNDGTTLVFVQLPAVATKVAFDTPPLTRITWYGTVVAPD